MGVRINCVEMLMNVLWKGMFAGVIRILFVRILMGVIARFFMKIRKS